MPHFSFPCSDCGKPTRSALCAACRKARQAAREAADKGDRPMPYTVEITTPGSDPKKPKVERTGNYMAKGGATAAIRRLRLGSADASRNYRIVEVGDDTQADAPTNFVAR